MSYLSGVRQRELYGSAYRVKEKISIEDLRFRTQRVTEREADVVRDQLIRNYVDIAAGTASFVDPHRVLITNEQGTRTLTADKVIIAVGTKPARPAGIEFDDRKIVDSNGLLKLTEIPRTMTFVGAGVVGVEYATIFRTLGVRVTLIDGRQRPLEFVDDEIEDALYFYMRDQGITVRFGENVSRVQLTDEGKVRVGMESGKELTTDALMFAAGRMGASEDLNLQAIGLEPDDRGRLKVDEGYRTSVENVYAVGDIIGFPSLASTSREQGRIAALHAFGAKVPRISFELPFASPRLRWWDVRKRISRHEKCLTKPAWRSFASCPGFRSVEFLKLLHRENLMTVPASPRCRLAMVGRTEEDLTAREVPYETGVAKFRELSRVQISGRRIGLLKLLFHRENLKLLGVHILGERATELVHIGQAIIDHGGTVEYLRDAVFNYPTLAEAYKTCEQERNEVLWMTRLALQRRSGIRWPLWMGRTSCEFLVSGNHFARLR